MYYNATIDPETLGTRIAIGSHEPAERLALLVVHEGLLKIGCFHMASHSSPRTEIAFVFQPSPAEIAAHLHPKEEK